MVLLLTPLVVHLPLLLQPLIFQSMIPILKILLIPLTIVFSPLYPLSTLQMSTKTHQEEHVDAVAQPVLAPLPVSPTSGMPAGD